MILQRWYKCALCRASTQHAVVGNRLLSCWDVQRLPTDHPPEAWRCVVIAPLWLPFSRAGMMQPKGRWKWQGPHSGLDAQTRGVS